jgi:hypothetical protein
MRRTILALILIQVIAVLSYACTKDTADAPPPPPPPTAIRFCDSITVSFSADIQPIMDNSCAFSGCHNSTGTTNGQFAFDTYAGVNAAQLDPKFWDAISHASGASPMPSGSPRLADSLLQKIECWIEQGALDN